MSLAVTVLASVGAFVVFQQELSKRQIAYLGEYVRERSRNVDRRFSNLSALHRRAAIELERRVAHLSDAEARALADQYFPMRSDGTRRSRPEYFDGRKEPGGGFTYGMGAFIGRAEQTPMHELKALVAAFPLVSSFGQAAWHDYDNFYFFTPATRLVMFGPDRPDRLMFYRQHAPPELDVSKEEMAQLTLPQNDPTRRTRCTNLQRLVQDNVGERLATGCITPAYVQGRYIGSFGSTIELSGFFLDAVQNPLPGASSLIVTDKGQLIAYPGIGAPGRLSRSGPAEATIAELERRLDLQHVVRQIAAERKPYGVVQARGGKDIIAYGRLEGPNWYLLMSYPRAAVAASAARSASWVLILGVLACIVQAMLVMGMARRAIVAPVQRLAATCEPERFGAEQRPDVIDIEQRQDEIGVLATALRTEREKVETVMASLEDRVHERTAELERANAEKSRFLANMSHELRTPLNGVIAISETLAREQATTRGRELAELIASSGRLLERVLTDILDFSKIEAGEITLSRDEFDMAALVERIAELHRAAAEAKGLALEWRVEPDAEGAFVGDAVRLTQVLSNLLSNAVKFTEAGVVRLAVQGDGEGVRIAVSDTGIGFDDAVKARLFRRFEQADASIRRRFGGTGLGLAISRSLIELMGGTIQVTSRPNEGSEFIVRLPLQRGEEAKPARDTDQGPAIDAAGLRVLLAEDHPTNQKVVQLILQSIGVEPEIVENGRQALDRLAVEPFDIVLMDMQMPELDGLAATAELRRIEAARGLPRTPVIMLTANALDEHVRASLEAGADRHLSKPIRASSLIEAIIEARQAAAAEAPPHQQTRIA
ncbi:MAG: ATP-binding protein [Phenylobacterium sp.]|uniref:ATP-binding protein n=1 Tax=Phenylobacterium sp. TaxID=1871053 RepID=UPI00391CB94D